MRCPSLILIPNNPKPHLYSDDCQAWILLHTGIDWWLTKSSFFHLVTILPSSHFQSSSLCWPPISRWISPGRNEPRVMASNHCTAWSMTAGSCILEAALIIFCVLAHAKAIHDFPRQPNLRTMYWASIAKLIHSPVDWNPPRILLHSPPLTSRWQPRPTCHGRTFWDTWDEALDPENALF